MRLRRVARGIVLTALLLAAPMYSRAAPENTVSPLPTVATLKRFLAAFNAHDLDAIMAFFADDCEFYLPRGSEPRGQRFVGKVAVRQGLASRFAGLPDVHYGDDHHWVAGNLGVSTWLLTGTTRAGDAVRVRGVDLLEFRDGKIVTKDSYWKIVEK
ncbi:MAG TPA: nuclear transport factor 2 family protein [Gemmatimonadales bacterium]|nr:nuclear transport factor 2 family protein [Gemmatimonadales bacterium]